MAERLYYSQCTSCPGPRYTTITVRVELHGDTGGPFEMLLTVDEVKRLRDDLGHCLHLAGQRREDGTVDDMDPFTGKSVPR